MTRTYQITREDIYILQNYIHLRASEMSIPCKIVVKAKFDQDIINFDCTSHLPTLIAGEPSDGVHTHEYYFQTLTHHYDTREVVLNQLYYHLVSGMLSIRYKFDLVLNKEISDEIFALWKGDISAQLRKSKIKKIIDNL
jgi:hypothetical protein